MAPVHEYSNWNKRSSNSEEQIEPYKHYYFICEGRNTERWYFEKLLDIQRSLNIHSLIKLVYLEKTGEHENLSNPEQLIQFADEQKTNGSISFDAKFDKMIVVFDADVFESQYKNYNDVVSSGEKKNVLGVTNPSFELFLLLHYENSLEEIVLPNQQEIIINAWVGRGTHRRRYIEQLFREKSGMRPKSNEAIGDLANNVIIAIQQEQKINKNIRACKGTITSNIGSIIQSIIDDQCE